MRVKSRANVSHRASRLASASQDVPVFRLQCLPIELQLLIFRFVFVRGPKLTWNKDGERDRADWETLSSQASSQALLVCRHFYQLGRPVLYSANTFHFLRRSMPKGLFSKIGNSGVVLIRTIQLSLPLINKTRLEELKKCTGLRELLLTQYVPNIRFTEFNGHLDALGREISRRLKAQRLPPKEIFCALQLVNIFLQVRYQAKKKLNRRTGNVMMQRRQAIYRMQYSAENEDGFELTLERDEVTEGSVRRV